MNLTDLMKISVTGFLRLVTWKKSVHDDDLSAFQRVFYASTTTPKKPSRISAFPGNNFSNSKEIGVEKIKPWYQERKLISR